MNSPRLRPLFFSSALLLTLSLLTAFGAPTPSAATPHTLTILTAAHTDNPPPPIPPPAAFTHRSAATPNNSSINVVYLGSWPDPARQAFDYAAAIWQTLLVSDVPIIIEAYWGAQGPGVLGSARATTDHRNFPGAVYPNTLYPAALANALSGVDRDSDRSDIVITINGDFEDWYFSTDANTPFDKYDLVSVALHELAHGLAFAGELGVGFFNGCFPNTGCYTSQPGIFDRFTVNGAGQNLVATFPNHSSQLAGQLTSNNVFFDGPQTRDSNGSQPARLYAPSTWLPGSSYAHLDENTFVSGSANALMTPSLTNGEAIHDPGPVTLGMLADMGWGVVTNTAPTFMGLPSFLLESGKSVDNAIDLWLYAEDVDTADSDLGFQIVNVTDPQAGVTIESGRFIDINPNAAWVGQASITVQVTDPDNASTTAAFMVTVTESEVKIIYLPIAKQKG